MQTLREHDAALVHWPGGFWTWDGCDMQRFHELATGARTDAVPTWWVGIQTVRGLERLGLIARVGRHPQEWKDARALTDMGRTVNI